MGASEDLKKVVLFRRGDTVQNIQTGEQYYVEYIHIVNYELLVITSNGVKIQSHKLRNLTWLMNNTEGTPEDTTDIDSLFE